MDKQKAFKENIFSWYSFKENANGIVYSTDEDYVQILRKKIKIVAKQETETLDYIIFIGEQLIFEKIQSLNDKISENTKIIVIQTNELSVQNISNYPSNTQMLENSNRVTLPKLEQKMKNLGFVNANIYYAFPNYDFVDMLFHKNYEINAEQLQKYIPTPKENEIKIMEEIKLLKKIISLDKNLLDICANSYFVEFSKKPEKQVANYVSFNNTRKEEYRLMTIIKDDIVEKVALNDKANMHLKNMKKNIEILKKQNVNLLDYEEKGKCYSKLIKNHQVLDVVLAEHYDDLDFIAEKFNHLKNILLKNAIDYNDEVEKSLQEYEIDSQKIKKLKFLENAWIDLIPKNCFEIENELHFFDQEWNRKFLPVDFVIYRGIINCYDLVKKIDINALYKKMNLTDFVEIFEKINQKIMNDILEKELYEKIVNKTVKRIDNIINERKIALTQISDFEKEDANKTEVIQSLQEEQIKKEQVIQDLMEEEKNKENYIKVLESIKTEKENEIENLNAMNQKKDETIQHLNEIIQVKDNQIAIYENMKAVKLVKKLRGNK